MNSRTVTPLNQPLLGRRAVRDGFTTVELLLSILLVLLLAGLLGVVVSQVSWEAKKGKCIAQQRNLYNAIISYSIDHQARLPLWTSVPADTGKNWHRTIWSYLSPTGTYSNWGSESSLELYRCPENPDKTSAISYAVNENLKDKVVSVIRGRTVVLVDHSGSQLVTGLKASLDQRLKGWHRKKNILTFLDGHFEFLARADIPDSAGDPAFWGTSNY